MFRLITDFLYVIYPSVLFVVVQKQEKKNPPRSFLSLNSEHLARGPAVLVNWKSTEHVHRDRQDFTKDDSL